MTPQTLKMHAVVLTEVPVEDTRALLRQAADALQAGQDLAHAGAALCQREVGSETRIFPAARKVLMEYASAVLDEPELHEEPDEETERPAEKARLRRNAARRPEEWGKPE